MTAPDLARPASAEEACRTLGAAGEDAIVIAGGTAVVLMLRQGLIAPSLLVSLDRIDGLSAIEVAAEMLRIGARVTLDEIAASGAVRAHAPALARACGLVGNVRVRNAATLAGNLAEADYASDPPAVLACLGATCRVRGPDGARMVPIADLITGFYSTALSPAELITEILVPVAGRGERSTYLKYVTRSSEDRPCVGVAARAFFRGDAIGGLSVTVGAVGSVPASRPDVCASVSGSRLDDATIAKVANGYSASIDPIEDARGSAWYRSEMIRVFITRALNDLRSSGG
jgi:carbon-monoxide dehydrogenase medium subunit